MDETFRLKRSYRNQGLGFLALFLAVDVAALYLVRQSDPTIPHPVALACLILGVPSFMAGLAVWMLAAYWRSSWTFRNGLVTERGVFKEKTLDLREVTSARWQWGPDWGRVVLRTESDRLTITFGNFQPEECERIVRHLRSALPPEVQVDWNLYVYKVKPFEPPTPPKTKPGPDEVLVRRDRYDRNFVPFLALASVLGAVFWRITGEWRPALGFPVVTLVGLVLLRFSIPAEGMVAKKFSTSVDPDLTHFFWFGLLWGLVAMAGMAVNEYFRPRMDHLDAILIVGIIAWLGVLIYEAYLLDRRQARRDHEAADLAAKARGESSADPWPSE